MKHFFKCRLAWTCTLFVLGCGGVASLLAAPAAPADRAPIALTVEENQAPLSTWIGLGIEFDPYQFPPTPDRWKAILERVAYSRPGFLRVMSSATDYCLGFDSQGEPIYVWQHPTPESQKRLDNLLTILDFAQAHHIAVYLGEWSPAHELGIHSPDDPRWPRIVADFVAYLLQTRHLDVIGHYIFFNEPNGYWMWPGGKPDFSAWSNGIRRLRSELDARSLQRVLLAGPDNSGDQDWFERSARELPTQFGSWESHIYATDSEVFTGQIEATLARNRALLASLDPQSTHKDRFIAESGLQDGKNEALDQQYRVKDFAYGVEMADYVAQIARAGWMGADAWDLDDTMHSNGHGGLKVWGFWDSSAQSDMSLRPWFYSWTLLSHALPQGAQILPVQVASAPDHFRATAARWTRNGQQQQSIVLINDDDTPRTVRFQLPVTNGRPFYCFQYLEKDRPADAGGFPKPARRISPGSHPVSIDLPGRALIVLSTESR